MGEQFNIHFVNVLKRYPQVYDPNHSDYHLRHLTDAAWAEISTQIGESVKVCKEKWKNLRTVFRRKLFKDPGKKPYYLNEHMMFMLPLIANTKTPPFPGHVPPDVKAEDMKGYEDGSEFDGEEEDCGGEDMSELGEDPMDLVEAVCEERKSPQPVSFKRMDFHRNSSGRLDSDGAELQYKGVQIIRCKSATSGPEGSSAKFRFRPSEPSSRRLVDPYEDDTFTAGHQRKRPKTEEPDHDDPDTQFLLSLRPEMGQLTPRQKRKFKKEVFNLLDNILDERQSSPQRNFPSSTSSRTGILKPSFPKK